jgi:DNA-directed RNA polymerase specialized sigma24 family protein
MRDPEQFDAFYTDARSRLLLQTYALTGDLTASHRAVRHAFVVAWHHWRKVSRLEDPEAWVRPIAWSHAQRVQTARLWHRDKALDPEVRATLDCLGKLSGAQRRALLLTQLAAVSMDQMAREIGLPLDRAERELQTATAQFSVLREVPSPLIRTLFEPLAATAGASRWPRATIIRRSGARRRRAHTAVGAAVAVASVVLSGVLVTDTAGVRPTLGRETHQPEREHQLQVAAQALPEKALLGVARVGEVMTGDTWRVDSTNDNSEGNGLVMPCQRDRYADPRGTAALVRTFTANPAKRSGVRQSVVQAAEASATARAARSTYTTALGWFAGCTEPRVQLLATRRVEGVGDQAMLLALRSWDDPATLVVGVARTGQITTTTLSRVEDVKIPPLKRSLGLLAAAVDGLCDLPDAGGCDSGVLPRSERVRPLPVGDAPGMLAELDLPPVATVTRPWVGTEPERATDNVAATRCDDADFDAAGISDDLTRTFVIPEADLPDQFGLTETVGAMPLRRARAFVGDVRERLAGCPDKDLGTDVTRLHHLESDDEDLSVWQLTTKISDETSVRYFMAILRSGTAVGQIQFIPSGKVDMADGAFVALAERALERLPKVPAPG